MFLQLYVARLSIWLEVIKMAFRKRALSLLIITLAIAVSFNRPAAYTSTNDFRVPLNQTFDSGSVLQRLRMPSRLAIFPDENHCIQKGKNSRFFYSEVHMWLRKYLADGAS